MTEDHDDHTDRSKLSPTTITQESITTTISSITKASEEPKGRSLNFTLHDHNHENELSKTKKSYEDLSDVSMDEDDGESMDTITMASIPKVTNGKSESFCTLNGLSYDHGEKLESACDSICTCTNGVMNCTDRCMKPLIKRDHIIHDPTCVKKDTEDPCCISLICENKTGNATFETCFYKNKMYKKDEKIEDGCSSICVCESSGNVACKPRCKPVDKPSDKCVEVPDPQDSCCKKVLCDVTLNDHDSDREQEESQKIKLISVKALNSTTWKIEFDPPLKKNYSTPEIEGSINKDNWKTIKLSSEGLFKNQDSNIRYFKIKNTNDVIEVTDYVQDTKKSLFKCDYKGHQLKLGEEYNDNCSSLCVCRQNGIQCLKIECPTYFGVDVLNPSCIEWESDPPDFIPSAPNCCPKSVKCKNNGSCEFKGESYGNWQQIPINITGCEKRCYCEMGNVECQNICPPVTALPSANLGCPPQFASLSHLPDDDCCMYWVCNNENSLPGGNKVNVSQEDIDNENNYTNLSDSNNLVSQTPSKILGPLIIYKNKPELNVLSNVTVNENLYDHVHSKDYADYNMKDYGLQHSELNGPFMENVNNNFPHITTKVPFLPTKPTQTQKTYKPNKTFHKPLVLPNIEHAPFIPTPIQVHPTTSVPYHEKDYADKLLQFINQHPELVNYPSGSVVEIHNVYDQYQKNPLHAQQNNLIGTSNNPIIPYVIPQHVGFDVHSSINPTDFLQHIHKHAQFLPTAPNKPNIPTRQNFTQPGNNGQYPGNFPLVPPGFQQPQDEVNVYVLEALDAHSVRLAFTVPSIIVGLHGQIDIRYTDDINNNNPNTWQSQVFTPPNDLIETPQLEVAVQGLKEDTEYKIKIIVTLRDLHNLPSSRIHTVRTMKDENFTTQPPLISIEPNLVVTDINATWVNIAWRKFSEKEMQYVDGVQLRYREIDGKIYAATPLIHRAVTTYSLENLKPNTKYEAGIFFIPFPGQTSELHAENMIHFTTSNEVDNYGFNVTLEIGTVKATSVEITWSGVPYPEDKYVNIYRAIYQSDSGKGDFSTFKVAKRDSPPKSTIMDLKPGVRYRLWLEVYLTNGRIKTSNVQDFVTKPRSIPSLGGTTQQGKLESGDLSERGVIGDYYGPLVIVAILATVAIISTLILLLILVKKNGQHKAAITAPPRISQSAYDNPTYKVEIQQETMNL
ncbi:hypothetical protein FQR65_LT11001 [Abscondita terminalis]|nr:hypothetical protein FQR65_LT11001 [Abscondita terminalis]